MGHRRCCESSSCSDRVFTAIPVRDFERLRQEALTEETTQLLYGGAVIHQDGVVFNATYERKTLGLRDDAAEQIARALRESRPVIVEFDGLYIDSPWFVKSAPLFNMEGLYGDIEPWRKQESWDPNLLLFEEEEPPILTPFGWANPKRVAVDWLLTGASRTESFREGELFVGPIYGVRFWRVAEDSTIEGSWGTPWESPVMVATCGRGVKHSPPAKNCSCGVYVATSAEAPWASLTNTSIIWGLARVEGRCRAGHYGIRAEKAVATLIVCHDSVQLPPAWRDVPRLSPGQAAELLRRGVTPLEWLEMWQLGADR